MGLVQEFDLEKTHICVEDDAYREADEQLLAQRLQAYCAAVRKAGYVLRQERERAYEK